MRWRRSIHLGEFRSPRWRKRRTIKLGRYEDHADWLDQRRVHSPVAARSSYRVKIEALSTAPVLASHRVDIWGKHEWSVKLPVEHMLGLSIGRGSSSGSSGGSKRNVDWYDLRASLVLLGQHLSVEVRTPYWRETREDYLHDKVLAERKWAAYLEAKRRSGCKSDPDTFARLEHREDGLGRREEVRSGPGGEPVLVQTDVSFQCAGNDPGCRGMSGRHWVYDEDLVAVAREEYSGQRHRREKEEAERLAEVARSISAREA